MVSHKMVTLYNHTMCRPYLFYFYILMKPIWVFNMLMMDKVIYELQTLLAFEKNKLLVVSQ